MAQRYEVTRLDGPKRTPQGGLRADAALTRTGVFVYRREDGSEVREYRSPEEVFKADSLASLAGAPVTKLHPNGLVTSSNFQKYAKGHVSDTVKQDGDKVTATVFIQDADLVAAVERGDMKQVSCGYTCDLEDSPGISPSGERYDRIQKNIQYNHAAIVPVGRAGADVALRLDAQDNLVFDAAVKPSPEVKKMKVELIEGVEYEVGSDPHKAARQRRDEAVKAEKADKEKLQARCDAAEADVAKLKKDLAELPAKIATEAKARMELESIAQKHGVKCDGLSDAEVRSAVIAQARPDIKLDGKGDAYVEAMFDIVSKQEPSDLGELHRQSAPVRKDAGKDEIDELDVEKVRLDSLKKVNELWRVKDVAELKNFGHKE